MELTLELHGRLKQKGLLYALIKEVKVDKWSGDLLSVTISIHKTMPRDFRESCTSIDDAMIMTCLQHPKSPTTVFIEGLEYHSRD